MQLEQLLARHGIPIQQGSILETHVLDVMRITDHKRRGHRQLPEGDVRALYRTLVGVHELATLIIEVQHAPSFDSLLPHLRLLNQGASLQNAPSPATDQATNKLFELFAACLAMRCGSDVFLDDPFDSSGDNPDVLATLGGRRWGIACKVLHSTHPEGFVQHLEKGLRQIQASSAEIGVVLFNLKNVLPHDAIWPLGEVPGTGGGHGTPELAPAAWPDPQRPWQILETSLSQLRETLVSYLPEDHLDDMFEAQRSIPGFLLWAHSVSAVLLDGRPTAASVRVLNLCNVSEVPIDVLAVLGCLNRAAL